MRGEHTNAMQEPRETMSPLAVRIRDFSRLFILPLRYLYLKKVMKYNIHYTTIVSFGAFLDKTRPSLITIGENTIITRGAVILSHDFARAMSKPTVIGNNCFIGVNSIVLPGVTIGDSVVIGAGSVVVRDIESNSLAAGNPARILQRINTRSYGQIIDR
jgi:acetyltransferase-like isoleucine patch superfamily enzyme